MKALSNPGRLFKIANYAADPANYRLANRPQIVSATLSLPNNKLQLGLYAGSLENEPLFDRANDGTGTPFAGNSVLKKSMVRIDFSRDGSLKHSWQTAKTEVGWDSDSQEMGPPEFVAQSIAATATTRPISIEATG